MIPAFVKELGNTNNKTAGTTLALTTTGATTAGNLIVAAVLFDNFTTASKPIVSSITKMAGETNSWVLLGAARSTSTSAGAFASGELWCIQTTVNWSAAAYTVTLDSSVTMKAIIFQEFSGAQAVVRSTTATAYSTTTTSASATPTGTAPVINDLAIGFSFSSNVAAIQSGANTANGWSTPSGVGSTGASAATNNFGLVQYRVATNTTQQVFVNFLSSNVTAGNGAIAAVLQAIPEPAITQAAYQFFDDAGTESGAASLAALNTAVVGNLSNGDGFGTIRVRLQSTTGQAVPATDDFKLQWEKNASGSWNDAVGLALLTSYDETNASSSIAIGTYSLGNGNTTSAQAFLGSGAALRRAGFYLKKSGTGGSGTITAVLYAHSGTFGSGTPTGAILATSTTSLAASALTTTNAWYYFDFDGTYTPVNGTAYYIGVQVTGHSPDDQNNVVVNNDNTSSTAAGNASTKIQSGTWNQPATTDLIFSVYTGGGSAAVIEYANPNLTEGQATTNRLGAGTGTFVAGKVTEDSTVDDLGWSGNNYTELLFSVKLIAAQLADGDTLRFRVVRNGSTATMTYAVTPTVNLITAVPAITQDAYRWYADDVSESGSTPNAAQNTAMNMNVDFDRIRVLRIRLQSTTAVAVPSSDDFQLQSSTNGGAWTNVTTSSVPLAYNTFYMAEGDPTTNRLTGGTGTFVAGKVSEDGLVDDVGWTANNFTELVYGLRFETATTTNGDVITFRVVRNGSTAVMTYTATPQINLDKTPPVTLVVDNCSHSHVSQQLPEAYLTPSAGGPASTPDPGIIPSAYVISWKIRGQASTSAASLSIATQNGSSSTRAWTLSRRGDTGAIYFQATATGAYPLGYLCYLLGDTSIDRGSPQVFAMAGGYGGSTTSYKSFNDGKTWTSQGSTAFSTQNVFDSPDPVIIGAEGTMGAPAAIWDDRIYWVELRTGSTPGAGTVLWRFDASEHVSGTSWTGSDGRTWTLNNASAVTHVAAATNITLLEVPAINLVVQNAAHVFVVQTDFSKFLTPSIGRASTPDPATMPNNGFVFVMKLRGPVGTGNSVVSQDPVTNSKSFFLQRVSNNTWTLYGYPAGTSASQIVLGYPVSPAIDAVNPEYLSFSYNCTTGRYEAKYSTNAGTSYSLYYGTTVSVVALFDSPDPVTIGAQGVNGQIWDDKIWWVECRTGVDPKAGTLLWRFDPNDWASGTGWTDPRGNVWTLSAAGAIGTPTSDTAVLTEVAPVVLAPADGAHAHAADNVDLLIPVDLVVQGATHTVVSQLADKFLDPLVATAFTPDLAIPAGVDITWVFKVNGPPSSAGATPKMMCGQWASSQFAYAIHRTYSTQAFVALVSATGTAAGSKPAITSGVPAGDEFISLTYTNAAVGNTMYRSKDQGATWVLEATGTAAASTAFWDSNAAIYVGHRDNTITSNRWESRVYWAECRTGGSPTGGTLLWRFDANEWASGTSWTDARGKVWTLTAAGGVTTSPDVMLTSYAGPTPLVVQDAAHAHTADNIALGVDITIQAAAHAHIAANVALDVVLVVASATHDHTAANVALGVDLVVQSAVHAHTADALTLNYVVLAPANAAHAHTADNVVVTQIVATNLVVANAAHAITSGYMGGAAASPYLFTEDWNVADDTHWDWAKWPIQRPYYTISGNKGIVTPSGGPSVAASDKYVTDFEMTVKVEWQTANPNYPEICWRLYDGLGGYSASSGYVAQVAPAGRVDLYKVGAYSSIGNFTDASLNAAGVRWFKVRVVGTSHKVKWWNDGSAEPGTWQIDATDSSPQTDTQGAPIVGGAIGFRSYGSPPTIVDDLTVVDLASPPLPVTDGSMRMLSNGKAIALNGNSNAFPSDTDLTWCGWVNYSGYSGNSWDIWSLFSGGSTYCSTSITPTGDLRQYMDTGDFSAGYNVPLNTWVFVAMSRSITGGTDLYWAPAGTSTLSTAHTSSKGTITGLKLRVLSGEYGSNPYANGCAFKCWTAALTKTQLEAEMTTYSVQRTANLFLHYSMRNGMFYAPDNDPLNDQKWIWWEQGAIVSGPAATHLLDAPAAPAGSTFFPDVPLGVDLTVNPAAHTSTSTPVVLASALDLVVQDVAHAHTADAPVLYPVPNLIVAAGAHTHVADNTALGVDITVNPATHTSTSTPVALDIPVLVQGATHAHIADAPTLYAVPMLAVDPGIHVHTAANVAIDVVLVVQGATHAHVADNAVTNYVVLALADGIHVHTAQAPILVVDLAVQDGIHIHTARSDALPPALLSYNFAEAGTTVTDRSGNGRNATLSPSDLHSNGQLLFTGTGQLLSYTPNAGALPQFASVTLKFTTSNNQFNEINLWSKMRVSNSSNFNLYVEGAQLSAVVRGTTTVGPSIIAAGTGNLGAPLQPNTTYQAALTYDGAVTRLYVNGVQFTTANTATGPLDMTGTDTTYSIGDAPLDTTTIFLAGESFYVDDVRFFDVALTAAQVVSAAATPVGAGADVPLTVDLSVQNAAHQHVADNLTVAGAGDLIVQSAIHQHLADNVAPLNINMDGVQSALHAHTAANVAIDVVIVVQSSLHAVTSDNAILTPGLLVDDALHAHSAAAPTITQAHNLVAQDAAHAHIADATVLTQAHNLTVDAVAHAVTDTSNPVLTQVHNLVVQDAGSTVTSPQLTVLGGSDLLIDSALHAHTAGQVLLTQDHNITVANAAHVVASDSVALYPVPVLVVNDGLHQHDAPAITLTQTHLLAVDSILHAHTATTISLAGGSTLLVDDSAHLHLSTSVDFTQAHNLTVQATDHASTSDTVTLYAVPMLAALDSIHDHTATTVVLYAVPVLLVNDGLHGHTAANVPITQVHELVVASTFHNHWAEDIVINIGLTLVVFSARHAHHADGDLDVSNGIVLNKADALFLGALAVDRVYLGTLQVWP